MGASPEGISNQVVEGKTELAAISLHVKRAGVRIPEIKPCDDV